MANESLQQLPTPLKRAESPDNRPSQYATDWVRRRPRRLPPKAAKKRAGQRPAPPATKLDPKARSSSAFSFWVAARRDLPWGAFSDRAIDFVLEMFPDRSDLDGRL